ncbi:MAG: hypothetical protein M1825_001040 [Sarcosagium campestre]|nr:MAG: hypothetical protein M1825_001040 [Sarcosagium campestre]
MYWVVPLCEQVVDERSARAIWKAAFVLIESARKLPNLPPSSTLPPSALPPSALPPYTSPPYTSPPYTSPPSTPPPSRHIVTSLFKDTLNRYNSGGLHNTSEPVDKVRDALKWELNSRLELDHPNFISTFFDYIPQAEDAVTAVFKLCQQGKNPWYKPGLGWCKWDGGNEKGVQQSLEEHLSAFMGFLSKAKIKPPFQRRFVPSPDTPLLGPVKRKPDICLATTEGESITGYAVDDPRWKPSRLQLIVPFELKATGQDKWESTWLDITKYAREIFRYQDSRRFVLGVTLSGSTMRLWEFDRLGSTTSKPFNIHTDGRLFVQILLNFLYMDVKQLGFDLDLMEMNGQRFVNINRNGKEERLIIKGTLRAHATCVAGRATTCWMAYSEEDKLETPLVVKDSWQFVERPEEGDLIRQATDAGVTNISQYYHHETVSFDGAPDYIRSNVRKGMSIDGGYNPLTEGASQMVRSSTTSNSSNLPLRRSSRVASIASQGSEVSLKRPSSQVDVLGPPRKRSRLTTTTRECDSPLEDRVRRRVVTRNIGHESLLHGGILHRDISIGNILLNEDETDGFLIDLDLAVESDRLKACGAPGRTGTKIFMAIGALDGEQHTFMHDLESFFWVLLWICAHYTGPGREQPDIGDFTNWNYEEPGKLSMSKSALAMPRYFKAQLEGFTTQYCRPLIPVILELWQEVFPGGLSYVKEDKALYSRMKVKLERAIDALTF